MSTKTESKQLDKEEMIDPRCIVKFRPADDWEGEYGFDWFREGDYGEVFYDNTRGNTMQVYDINGNPVYDSYGNPLMVASESDYYGHDLVGKYKGWVYICNQGIMEQYWKQSVTGVNEECLYDSGYGYYVSAILCGKCSSDNNCSAKTRGFFKNASKLVELKPKVEVPIQLDPDHVKPSYFRVKKEDVNGMDIGMNQYFVDDLKKYYKTIKIGSTGKEYVVPYISLFYDNKFGKCDADIKIKITANSDIKKIVFECDRGNKGITCLHNGNTEIIFDHQNRSCDETVKVTIAEDFKKNNQDVFVNVWAIDNDDNKSLAGKVCVVKCRPKYVDIVLIPLKVRLNQGFRLFNVPNWNPTNAGGQAANIIEKEKENLKKFLSQTQLIPRFIEKRFLSGKNANAIVNKYRSDTDPTKINLFRKKIKTTVGDYIMELFPEIAGRINIVKELEIEFNKEYPLLRNKYKLFFLDIEDSGTYVGRGDDIGSKSAIVLHGPQVGEGDPADACHELVHCFGLWHSFSNNSPFTFEKYRTSNIMDYPALLKQVTFWKWQWDEIKNKAVGESVKI